MSKFSIKFIRLLLVLTGVSFILTSCETTTSTTAPRENYFDIYYLDSVVVDFTEITGPMHVAEIETNFRKASLANGTLANVGQRFSGTYRNARDQYLNDQIAIAIKGQVKNEIGKMFKGTKPAVMKVVVDSVFIRSRGNLASLTGTTVIRDGVRMPDKNQLIAGIELVDPIVGLPIDLILKAKTEAENSVVLFNGGGIEQFGQSKRVNQFANNWAKIVAQEMQRTATGGNRSIYY